MEIRNKTLLVTGANRGLGRAIVEASLDRGASRVYAGARDVRTLAPLMERGQGRVLPLQLDVTDARSLTEAHERVPALDVLINNAGLLASFGALTSPLTELQRDLNTNYFGLLAVTRAFLPALQRAAQSGRRAALVNVLSVVSLGAVPGLAGYSASKAAAHSLTQALRVELGAQNIGVYGVYPGPIDTDMVRAMEMPKTSPDEVARALLDGLAEESEDIAPDPTARALLALFGSDPKAAERQLGAM